MRSMFPILVLFLLEIYHPQPCCSIVFVSVTFSKRPSSEVSISKVIDVLHQVSHLNRCALSCLRIDKCTSFAYSQSQGLCHVGTAIVPKKDDSYSPDTLLFKTDSDYYTSMSCYSDNEAYRECPLDSTASTPSLVLLNVDSIAQCLPDVSYGLTAEMNLWVDKGCRATFGIGV